MKRTAILVEKKKKHKRQRSKTPQPVRQRKQPTFKSNDPATKDTTKTYSTTRKSRQDIFDEYAAREPLQLRQTRQETRSDPTKPRRSPAPRRSPTPQRKRPLSAPTVPRPTYRAKLSDFDPISAEKGQEYRSKNEAELAARRKQYAAEPSPSPGPARAAPATVPRPAYDGRMDEDAGPPAKRMARKPSPVTALRLRPHRTGRHQDQERQALRRITSST